MCGLDYATLDRLVKGKFPGGWIMKKYVASAFDPIPEADIPEGPPSTLVQWQRPPLRTVNEVWSDARECQAMGDEKKEPGTCNSRTKGPPLLVLSALFTQAGILHKSLGIVCDSMNDLDRDLEELDQRFGPVEQTTAEAMRNAKIRIADAEAVVEDLLANVFVLQDVLGQLSHEVVRLKERMRVDDKNSDAEDDSLRVSLLNRVEEVYGWLPSRQSAVAQRRSGHAQRVKARGFRLYATEQELATAKEEESKMVQRLESAQKELALNRKNYKKLRGDHVMALQFLPNLAFRKRPISATHILYAYCPQCQSRWPSRSLVSSVSPR